MKRLLVFLLLIACVAAVAFASLRTNSKSEKKFQQTEKKQDQKKKECKRTCMFS